MAWDPEDFDLSFSMGDDVTCVDAEQYDGVCEGDFDSDYRMGGGGQLEVAVFRESGKLHAVSITAIVRDSGGLEGTATVSISIGGARCRVSFVFQPTKSAPTRGCPLGLVAHTL